MWTDPKPDDSFCAEGARRRRKPQQACTRLKHSRVGEKGGRERLENGSAARSEPQIAAGSTLHQIPWLVHTTSSSRKHLLKLKGSAQPRGPCRAMGCPARLDAFCENGSTAGQQAN
eukprot:9175266-Pyramimonas_sp.AAC.1